MGFILLMTALLSVPFLNLLVGAFVGFATLIQMLKTRHFARLLGAAVIAGIWFIFAILQALSVGDGRHPAPGSWQMWTIPVAALAFAFMKFVSDTGKSGLKKQLAQSNALGKGTFSLDLGFGTADEGVVVLFDPKTRHVAFLTDKTHRVEPLSFIKTWEITWKVINGSSSSYRLQINTRDFARPVVYALVSNLATAEHWSERMDNLINYGAQPEPPAGTPA